MVVLVCDGSRAIVRENAASEDLNWFGMAFLEFRTTPVVELL